MNYRNPIKVKFTFPHQVGKSNSLNSQLNSMRLHQKPDISEEAVASLTLQEPGCCTVLIRVFCI